MHPPLPHFLTTALLCAILAAPAYAEPKVWLDDHFKDGERNHQTLPESAEWFSSSASSTVTASPGSLTQTGGGRHLLAYFTGTGSPASLAPGESIVLTYELSLLAPKDGTGTLRVGLFNSTGARIVTDKQGRSGDFIHYTGYMGAANPLPSKPAPLLLFKRITTTGDDTLIGALPPFQPVGEPGGITQPMNAGRTYTGTFKVHRPKTGDACTLTHRFAGADLTTHEVTGTDAQSPAPLFDTVVIHTGTRGAEGFVLKSVRVETITE